MKRPVRYSRGRVRYTGRLDRSAFAAWCKSAEGQPVLEQASAAVRFAVFGRARVARRCLWREVAAAARRDTVVAALQREIDRYLARLDTLVFAHDLPRVGIDLHRLVAVPRLFANAATVQRVDALLDREPVFAAANGGTPLRDWFIATLIDAIESAVVDARPSPKQPVPAGEGWVLVGVNDLFEWGVPLTGPAWPGHYYVLELTRAPITRAIRGAVGDAIPRMDASLASLSRVQRNEILRQARLSLEQLLARA